MHLPHFRFPVGPRRLLIVALGVLAMLLGSVGAAAAVEPIDPRDPATLQRVAPPVVVVPDPTLPPAPAADVPGIDVSWPQCGAPLPETFGFAIVGVNGGRAHAPNPCLGGDASQLAWAGPDADLYINTGNPGPEISLFWPHGQSAARACNTSWQPGADTPDCAYLYGWNAAADSYATALEAFVSLGWAQPDAQRIPGERTWWLDVETANSWRGDRSLNVAALRGAVDYLGSMEVAEVGFYSTPLLWERVTGGTTAFAHHPAWHAGASDAADAVRRCDDEPAFTGGELQMVQWVEEGLDRNIVCA